MAGIAGVTFFAGCSSSPVTPSPQPAVASATPGPRFGGGRIYWSVSDPPNWGVFSANPDGTDRRQLAFAAGDLGPSWSPDASQAAIARPGLPAWTLWITAPDGSNPRKVASFAGVSIVGPTWSPDGTRIAVVGITLNAGLGPTAELRSDQVADVGPSALLVVDVATGKVTTISQKPSGDSPAWSPDGTRIAFGSKDGGIWTIHPDGTGYAQLTGGDDTFPAWSRDGHWLAFQRSIDDPNVDVDHDLVVVRADGTGARVMTTGPSDDELPAWSPDGTALTFTRFVNGGNGEIMVLAPDGTLADITNTPNAADVGPAWH